ncbi:hypothetical protein FGO68_gene16114 [Halteria grandinella]|uniref:Uncharacterized protein n=1 Tax=Halteria grandinella TaxID=5974 RepID=A0A8J8NAX7_HALGN|nr:hypothetical protein FGO68_gene16114 [Halteria grandinella]
MLHRLCGPPSIPLSFTVAGVLPRWITQRFRCGTDPERPTPSYHRLQCGLPGYLILFDTHTFVPQCQFLLSKLPTSTKLKSISINGTAIVKRPSFTTDLINHLRTLQTQQIRTTLAPSVLPRLLARSQPVLIHIVPSLSHAWASSSYIKAVYNAQRLLPARGMAGSGFRPLPNIPYCCLPQESGPYLSASVGD